MIPLGELNRMHQFRDKSAAQREMVTSGLLFYPVLMSADVLAYRAHEVPVGEDQREHLEVMRRAAERFNKRFGELLVVPEARIPEVGARVTDLQEPDRKMSTTGGTEQGTVYVLDDPDAIRRKFKRAVADSGREVVRAADKPGISNMIEIMAVARGDLARAGRARVRRLRLWRLQGRRRGRRRRLAGPGARALRGAAGRRGPLEASSRPAPTRRARSPGHAGRRARRDGRRSRPAVRRACRLAFGSAWPRSPHRLELDLDVFAGPFDLLLSLILREELDLLEVELAEIVIAYIDHLEAEGELDLEAATEFLVLIAALLELKSRLMLPGEEALEELDELAPAEAAEELLERMLAVRALPRRRRLDAGRARRRPGVSVPQRAAAARAAARVRRGGRARLRPEVLGQAIGSLLRTPPPLDLRHMAMPRVSVADRLAHLRACSRVAAAASASTRPSTAPTA